MKYFLFLIILFSSGCKKNIGKDDIIERTTGNYNCLRYSFFWSSFQPYTTSDSTYPVPLVIQKHSDSSIMINGTELVFQGLYSDKFLFLSRQSGISKGHTLNMENDFSGFAYSIESGGLGGASGTKYEWKK